MSPPKATPDMKQRGIASFFGGGGGAGGASAGAAKKTPAAETTTTVEAKKASASADADAAATVVDAKQREELSAGKKVGDNDVVMVDSLDSDVKRELRRKREKRERGAERREREEATDSTMRTLRRRFVGPPLPRLTLALTLPNPTYPHPETGLARAQEEGRR